MAKEGMKSKQNKKRYIGEFEGEKLRGKFPIYIIIKNLKWIFLY